MLNRLNNPQISMIVVIDSISKVKHEGKVHV